jgi:hypothetical protein
MGDARGGGGGRREEKVPEEIRAHTYTSAL